MARAICKDKKLSSSKPLFHPLERYRKGRSVDGRVKPGQDGPSAKIRPRNLNQQLSLQAPKCRPSLTPVRNPIPNKMDATASDRSEGAPAQGRHHGMSLRPQPARQLFGALIARERGGLARPEWRK